MIDLKGDTVIKGVSDRFVFFVSDSLKEQVNIQVVNGRLNVYRNDSTAILQSITGMQYETVFVKNDQDGRLHPATRVNGAAPTHTRKEIIVSFHSRKEKKVLLSHTYYFKD